VNGSSSGGGVDWSQTPFRQVELIGRGGMGAVYRGFDLRVGRPVALKLQQRGSPASRARFLREGQLAAALQHPNVIQVHEICSVPQGDILVCELVEEAEPLDAAWRSLDTLGRIRLLRDAAAGVAAAHEAGIVHRDLKPDNVLVDASGRVRVGDFGVAYSGELDRLTQTGAMVGTPSFMAPEQLSGNSRPTAACDVWSLGVLLYLALTDRLPFEGRTILELAAQVATGASDENLRAVTRAPAPLRALIRRCLAKEPQDRLAHAGLVRDALQRWLDDPVAEARASRALIGLALGVSSLLGALGVGAYVLRDSGPLESASPTATVTESRPESERSLRIKALLDQLQDPNELLAYTAALAVSREFPDHVDAPKALAIRARLRGRPLLVLRSGANVVPRGKLIPTQGPALIWAAGDRRVRRWSPAGEEEAPLPRVRRSVIDFTPGGRVLFHSTWKVPRPGLYRVDWSAEPAWLLDPAPGGVSVTAACDLGGGRLAVGGAGEVQVLVAGETVAEAKFPGEVADEIWPFDGGLLCVTVKEGEGVPSTRIHLFGPDLKPRRAPIVLPGSDVRLTIRPGDRRLLIANAYFSKLSVVDIESGAAREIFAPTMLDKKVGSIERAAWVEGAESAMVLSRSGTGGTSLSRWSLEEGVGRLWAEEFPASRNGTFAGAGPDFMVLCLKGRIQVHAISTEKP